MNRTLPSGTVTFLLTDIEGSTRLWQEVPDAMAALALSTMFIKPHGADEAVEEGCRIFRDEVDEWSRRSRSR